MRAIALVFPLMLPLAANAMQSLDDTQLSEQTGQAGVTIEMNTNVRANAIRIVDTDGLGHVSSPPTGAYAAYDKPAQVLLEGYGIEGGGLTMRMDAASNGANGLFSMALSSSSSSNIKLYLSRLSLAAASAAAPHTVSNKKTVIEFNPGSTSANDKYTEVATVPGGEIRFDFASQPTGSVVRFNNFQLASVKVNGGYAIVDAACQTCGIQFGNSTTSPTITGASGGNINLSGTVMGVNATDGLYMTLGSSAKFDITTGPVKIGTIGTAGTQPAVGSLTMKGLDVSGTKISMKGY